MGELFTYAEGQGLIVRVKLSVLVTLGDLVSLVPTPALSSTPKKNKKSSVIYFVDEHVYVGRVFQSFINFLHSSHYVIYQHQEMKEVAFSLRD